MKGKLCAFCLKPTVCQEYSCEACLIYLRKEEIVKKLIDKVVVK